MRPFSLLLLLLLSAAAPAAAQDSLETEIAGLVKRLYRSGKDPEKLEVNRLLMAAMEEKLRSPSTFSDHILDSLRRDVGILESSDGRLRIVHWNIPMDDGTHQYHGFIQHRHTLQEKKGVFSRSSREVLQLFRLNDQSATLRNPENAVTNHEKWFGCLYNRIIVTRHKKKTMYTLLGWDGNDRLTQKKIIEVLTFDANGTPRFGADAFVMPKRYPKRIIFEYGATCTMSLRYSASKDSIVFDHLAPLRPQLEGQYQYYCGDMSYDGLGFKRGKWHYGADVNAVNEKDENDRMYHDPKDRSHGSRHSNQNIAGERKKRKKK